MSVHSLSQTATLLGVHRNTLSQWLREGCPAVVKADRERGVEWQLALPDIIAWRIERAVGDAVASHGGDGTGMSVEEAQRRRAVALAQMAEIDLDDRLQLTVERGEVVGMFADFCQSLRQGVSNGFDKIASRGATITSSTEIRHMCESEWNRAMGVARAEFRRTWDATLGTKGDRPEADPSA